MLIAFCCTFTPLQYIFRLEFFKDNYERIQKTWETSVSLWQEKNTAALPQVFQEIQGISVTAATKISMLFNGMSSIRGRCFWDIDHSLRPPPSPPLTAFFSGVSAGEVADRRFSRLTRLPLGSLSVLFSSLMLAWCFNKTSWDLSRN